MNNRDISKTCEIKYQQQLHQQIIINGIPQGGHAIEVPYLTCPSCNNVIIQFNGEAAITAICDYCEKNLKDKINYCVKCGQRLRFPTLITCNNEQENKDE